MSFLLHKLIVTFFFEFIDVGLHDEDSEISIEDLNRVIEDTIFNKFPFMIFLDVFGIDFSFPFNEELSIGFINDFRTFVSEIWLHSVCSFVENLMIFMFININIFLLHLQKNNK